MPNPWISCKMPRRTFSSRRFTKLKDCDAGSQARSAASWSCQWHTRGHHGVLRPAAAALSSRQQAEGTDALPSLAGAAVLQGQSEAAQTAASQHALTVRQHAALPAISHGSVSFNRISQQPVWIHHRRCLAGVSGSILDAVSLSKQDQQMLDSSLCSVNIR